MTLELMARHRKALAALQYECDYEDDRVGDDKNYVLWEQVANSGGPRTRSDLVDAGYAVAGPHRWSEALGYRITESGRAALSAEPPPKAMRQKRKLKPLPPRLGNVN